MPSIFSLEEVYRHCTSDLHKRSAEGLGGFEITGIVLLSCFVGLPLLMGIIGCCVDGHQHKLITKKAKLHGVTTADYIEKQAYYDNIEKENERLAAEKKSKEDKEEKKRQEILDGYAKGIIPEAIELPARAYMPEHTSSHQTV